MASSGGNILHAAPLLLRMDLTVIIMTHNSLKYTLAAAALTLAAAAFADNVTLTQAGTLEQALGRNAATVTELTVSGPVNAADLYFLGENAPKLTALDLGAAVIEAYNGTKKLHGFASYEAALIPAGAFGATALESVILPRQQGLAIGAMAFANTPLKALPDMSMVAKVDDGAFSGCAHITAVTWPAAAMGTNVFAGSGVQTVAFTADATVVPAGTFSGCSTLKSVTGSDKVTAIGDGAFESCTALAAFSFSKSITAIGQEAFRAGGLEKVELASPALRSIGALAFANCPDLESASITGAVTELGEGIFFDDTALAKVTLPTNTPALSAFILKGASKAVVELPASVKTIEKYALKDNTAIQKLTLPGSVTAIGDGAMENMTALTDIDFSNAATVPALGDQVWAGVDQSKVWLLVPDDLAIPFSDASQWRDFKVDWPSSGHDDLEIDKADQLNIRARFNGTVLELCAPGQEIASVRLFDVAGMLLTAADGTGSNSLSIDTAAFPNPLFVVNVSLADGAMATLKLRR